MIDTFFSLPFLPILCYKLICLNIGKKLYLTWQVFYLILVRKNLIFNEPYPDKWIYIGGQ